MTAEQLKERLLAYEGLTYRGLPAGDDKEFELGATLVPLQFTSTSLVDSHKYIKERPVLLVIEGVSGRRIENIAYDPQEKEVLFSPGTRFVIYHKEVTPEKTIWYLKEINQSKEGQ